MSGPAASGAGPVGVLIVDDHAVVREGLRAILATRSDVRVVGSVASRAEAVAACDRDPAPDVVLMDLNLGLGGDGAEATRQITAHPAAPAVLVLTTYETDADILRAIRAGAIGYLLKDAAPADLVDAIVRARRGETVLAPPVAARMMTRLADPPTALTERELEVLELVGEGASNREIARALTVTEATVKTHLVHVFTKLGVDSRTRAVAAARSAGLLRGRARPPQP